MLHQRLCSIELPFFRTSSLGNIRLKIPRLNYFSPRPGQPGGNMSGLALHVQSTVSFMILGSSDCRPALDLNAGAEGQPIHSKGAARRQPIFGEVGDIHFAHRTTLTHVSQHHRTFDDLIE